MAATPVSVPFITPGEISFTVPSGVRTISVVVTGGRGASPGGSGGFGARVTADLPVVSLQRLFVVVGANGSGSGATFGGGGAGGAGTSFPGGAGGGASDIRTVSSTQPGSLASRLVVAAGGGGGAGLAGAGGSAGANGLGPVSSGGSAGTPNAGGAGGIGNLPSAVGASGLAGIGGAGGTSGTDPSGGGGGGGWFGGGGGAAVAASGGAGGGGGGSSFVIPAATASTVATDATGAPAVTISYVLVPSISLAPSGLTFPALGLGTTGPLQKLTVTNDGSDPLVVSGVAITGPSATDFGVENLCSGPVAAGAACSIFVRFTPRAKGIRSAIVTVNSNALGIAPSILVTGTGGAATTRTLTGLRLTPSRFTAAKGTTVTYRASAAGTTTLTVLRHAPGRRVGTRCVALPPKPSAGVRCTRLITVGALRHTDTAGLNTFALAGRLKGRTLAPGRYTLRVKPGPGAATSTKVFTITK